MMVINNEKLKYQYGFYSWGGFYNDEHKKVHKQCSGLYIFNTEHERINVITELKRIEEELNAKHLVIVKFEGYNCQDEPPILHRVVEYKGDRYYSKRIMNIPNYFSYDSCEYMQDYKWTPGFNDEVVIDDDEKRDNVKIIQEWVTGSFTFNLD